MKFKILFIFVMLEYSRAASIDQDVINRLVALENYVENMEDLLVERYGLIKRCVMPSAEHGSVRLIRNEDMKPGTRISVVCDPGYVASPGKSDAKCMKGGEWSNPLQCEVPLVVVGGGQVSEHEGDISVEVLDFSENSTCNVNIPDMPIRDNSQRVFNNLIYSPEGDNLLVCNGLTTGKVSICDAINLKKNSSLWKHHSYTNKGSDLENNLDNIEKEWSSSSYKPRNPNADFGRYAAESLTIDNKPFVIGGMIYDQKNHWVTDTTREFENGDWSRLKRKCQMNKKRAFFCSIKVQENGIIDFGGFSDNGIISDVQFRRGCADTTGIIDLDIPKSMESLPEPLSGHACSWIPNSNDILVSGGSSSENEDAHRTSYIYRWSSKNWEGTGDMNTSRFGHRIVTVGTRVLAIGGKERNPDRHLDTIEEFQLTADGTTRQWKVLDTKMKKTRAHFGIALVPRSLFPGCN